MEEYHQYADATMDALLDSLENLLDEAGSPEYEVEYSVSPHAFRSMFASHWLCPCSRAASLH